MKIWKFMKKITKNKVQFAQLNLIIALNCNEIPYT